MQFSAELTREYVGVSLKPLLPKRHQSGFRRKTVAGSCLANRRRRRREECSSLRKFSEVISFLGIRVLPPEKVCCY